MSKVSAEIIVIGGGAAGMSAAVAASARANVAVVDDNPLLGGQIWRAEIGKVKSADARLLIDSLTAGHINIINNAQVFGPDSHGCLLAETPDGTIELDFEKLILSTGARERFLPFPGWTLTNVLGAGGLQAMVKGGLNIKNKRVVVAGTGPLLLAVADYLKAKGAAVLCIAEQAPAAKIRGFAFGLWRYPAKIAQGVSMRIRLRDVPFWTDSWVTNCSTNDGATHSITVTVSQNGKARTLDCDYLACGFHLIPNTELASVLGCRIETGPVSVNEFQQTSVANIYCAGEPTGIGGIEASLIEGKIAGLAATGQEEAARRHFAERNKTRRFANALNETFALRDELKNLPAPDTLVCRCEDVEYGRLTEFANFRDAKLQTRCGMGPCQGRICGAATEFMFGWKPGSVRPPIFPVKMENL